MYTEAIEVCPYCEAENVYPNWDVKKDGYIAKCKCCGELIFLCDECAHADDNPERACDWHERGMCSMCFRGTIHRKEKAPSNEIGTINITGMKVYGSPQDVLQSVMNALSSLADKSKANREDEWKVTLTLTRNDK